MNIRSMPSYERPRERLEKKGAAALSDSELLAIIIGKGTRKKSALDIAGELLSQFPLERLSTLKIGTLKKIPGIGLAKAAQIVSSFELARRSMQGSPSYLRITCPEDVHRLLYPVLKDEKQEHFIVLHLDTKKFLIRQQTLFIGTLDSSLIHPREIFRSAIENASSSIIVAHNHPSGDPTPSREDLRITEQLKEAGKLVGIPLLDHVIIGEGFRSLRD